VARYLIKRVLLAMSTLLAASVATFWLFFAIPSDPAAMQCGKFCTPDQIVQIRTSLGLDRPTHVLYLEYMKGIFVGRTIGRGETQRPCPAPCLGYSYKANEPVLDILKRTLPTTLSIVFGAAFLWIVGGVAIGVTSALARGTWLDKAAIGFSLAGASTQIYFIGLVLQLVLVFQLHWLPTPRYVSPRESVSGWIGGMLLAWTTLAFVQSALYARLTRAQMLETLSEDFVRTARAKGLPNRTVQLRHALRAAITPIITIAGLDIGVALGGTVITENVFGMTGIGLTSVHAAQQMNLPIVMATVLLASFFVVMSNLLVDLLYTVIDPRVRLGA
jgi:peptide/nickel transport system permease protein